MPFQKAFSTRYTYMHRHKMTFIGDTLVKLCRGKTHFQLNSKMFPIE